METYQIFRDLAIIIVAAKFFGILARKCKAPSVVGEIIAGLIIGPSLLGLVQESDFTVMMAEIGVVLLMFSAGLETTVLPGVIMASLEADLLALTETVLPSEVTVISPFRSVQYTFTSASRRRLNASSVGCP